MNWVSFFLIVVAIPSFSDTTQTVNIKKFNAAQTCFKNASSYGQKRITCAQDALNAGLLIFEDSNPNIIFLTHNLAMSHPRLSGDRYEFLQRALKL